MKEDKKKIVHYSSSGYNGDFTYNSVCGKRVNQHKDNEEISVTPEVATCPNCKKAKQYITH